MWILLMLALAAQAGEGTAPTPAHRAQVPAPAPPSKSWFSQEGKPFGSLFRTAPTGRNQEPGPQRQNAMTCTLRILKADPKFDASIVKPAPPDLDPKIVRPSPCKLQVP